MSFFWIPFISCTVYWCVICIILLPSSFWRNSVPNDTFDNDRSFSGIFSFTSWFHIFEVMPSASVILRHWYSCIELIDQVWYRQFRTILFLNFNLHRSPGYTHGINSLCYGNYLCLVFYFWLHNTFYLQSSSIRSYYDQWFICVDWQYIACVSFSLFTILSHILHSFWYLHAYSSLL